MKNLLLGFLLATLTLTAFAASNEDNPLAGKDRIYLYDKKVWVFVDGFVNDPPYASFWSGINAKEKNYRSVKNRITFHCQKRLVRIDAMIFYSLPNNKGKIVKQDYEEGPWRPIDPESFFNFMHKTICLGK